MAILGKLFWIALTLVFTFCFVVLFEYGPSNFADNAQHEFKNVKELFNAKPMEKRKDASDKAVK
jgi:hypothetical protein